MKKRIISIFLIVSIIASIFAVSAVSTSVGAASNYSLAQPQIKGVRNEGPMGRRIYWDKVPGATWYRVYKQTANGWQSVSKANTKQNWIYDTYPNNNGDTYVLRCVKGATGNDYTSECSERCVVSVKKCDAGYAAWLIGKQIKASAAKASLNYYNEGKHGKAGTTVILYKDKNCKSSLCTISMNGKDNILRVKGVEYRDDKNNELTNAEKTMFKVTTNDGKLTGYINMNYALVNVNQYIPAAKVDLSFTSKEAYTWHIKNRKSQMTDKPYNMFNYQGKKGNTDIINGLNDTVYYNANTAWLRYDVAVKLLDAQRDMFRRDYPWQIKLYDAYRPHDVTGKIDKAWDNYIYGHNLDPALTNQIASASYVSMHNTARAVDMSIIDARTGNEYEMPTYMHDLSWNSSQENWLKKSGAGNQNATYMYNFMTERGWEVYSREWWHFEEQNIATKDLIGYAVRN